MEHRQMWRERTIREAGLNPDEEATATFETFKFTPGNRAAKGAAADLVLRFNEWLEKGGRQTPLPFLLLYGPAGVGKTHLCYGIAWSFLEMGQRVIYRQAEVLFDDLRASFDGRNYDRIVGRYLNYELVIIDDVGAESDTPWSMAKLDMIIDHRYRYRLATVMTTNTLDLPPRIADRFKDGMVRQIKGTSWRGKTT